MDRVAVSRGSRIPLGEFGTVNVRPAPGGGFKAEGRWRSWDGNTVRLRASGTTEDHAIYELKQKARINASPAGLNRMSTIQDLGDSWLRARRDRGDLRQSSYEIYAADMRNIIYSNIGAVRLVEVRSGLLEDFILTRMRHSYYQAKRARYLLMEIFKLAERLEVVSPNPVLSTTIPRRPKGSKKANVALTVEDVHIIRAALDRWAKHKYATGAPSPGTILGDTMEVMLGTTIRIGECLSLRGTDVQWTTLEDGTQRIGLRVGATVSYTRAHGNLIQESTKFERQERIITLPPYAASVIERRFDPDTRPDHLLFPSSTGTLLWTNNYRRRLRKFLATSKELVGLSIDPTLITPKIFRKTVATLLTRNYGVSKAAEILGHGHERTTEEHYVQALTEVNPEIADLLQMHLAEVEAPEGGDYD